LKSLRELALNPKINIQESGPDGGYAAVNLGFSKDPALVVFSWGGGWDHVSVSYRHRCCTWDEMCQVKDMFFREDEWAAQYHPAKADYVNNHPFTLHLWRPQAVPMPVPPKEFV